MTPDRRREIEDLYRAAQGCKPDERAVLLDSADPELRYCVGRMLEINSGSRILDQSPASLLADTTKTISSPGAQLGPYKIEAQVGSGGMGIVYRAIDTRLGRSVAIKLAAERYSARFQLEAQAISTLNHPHICTLYDVGPNYLVMEFIEGSTLAAAIKSGPLAPETAARYGEQIAGALAEAHSLGIVHRDLKPSNIMLTRHGVKVLDFGLAKITAATGITATNAVMGTPAYMAPEQVEGQESTPATDLFALGLVLFEMSVGRLPFPGASLGQMLSSGAHPSIPVPSRERAGVPPGLDALVARLLEEDPAKRPRSAADVARELSAISDRLTAPPSRSRGWPVFAIPAVALLLLLAAGGAWLYHRSEQRHWVREQAIPEISRLEAKQPLAAYLLLRKAEQILPGDPQLRQIAQSSTRHTSVESTPTGANVEIQDYVSAGPWYSMGTTPLKNVRIPNGYFRWRISKPGAGEFVAAPPISNRMQFALAPQGSAADMVPVPGGEFSDYIDFLGWLHYQLPTYDIDRFEVTNAQFQEFVDQGGYGKPEYWKEKFIRDGGELSWQQAMDLFRDATDRSGPSTWAGGHFPPGQASYPVSGVSWYEAAAYAAFAGKTLPVLGQWYEAAPPDFVPYIVNQSNFNEKGPVPVGTFKGVGPFGTYDMSGNVREWCWNTVDSDRRLILGGAWGTQVYQASIPEALSPFDRSAMNGLRLVRNKGPLVAAASAPLVVRARDFSKARPVSDDVFQAYRALYAYDPHPLNPKSDGIVENTPDWTKERITIDAGYGNERLTVYLFLPKNVHSPYQTVVFYPSARVNFIPSSQNLGDLEFFDYVIQSGRALIYPIYQGTYGRSAGETGPIAYQTERIEDSKEVRRSVDYLETRPEIDRTKIAYLGVSQGAAEGLIYATMEERFKAIVFLDGGFFMFQARPSVDQVNFAPRLKKPVLMVNGRYDFTFSPERAQEPMFLMLGTPEAQKRRVVFDTPHDVSQNRGQLSKEVLAWLDKYLGKVN